MRLHLTFPFIILSWISFLVTYSAAVIGIDLGTEFIKVSLYVHKKPLEMVENIQSQTKTPFAIAIKNNERVFGAEAVAKKSKMPESVFVRMQEFLGKTLEDEEVQKYINDYYISYDMVDDTERKSINFKVNFENSSSLFSSEEIMAMMFRYIKFISSKYAHSDIKECVVTVPGFFSYKQRQSMIQAVDISGMKLLKIINDNVGAAVKYGMDNRMSRSTVYMMFYNMGASYTQVSLVSYRSSYHGTKGNTTENQYVSVLEESFDRNLGGRNFDYSIVRKLLQDYNSKHTDTDNDTLAYISDYSQKPTISEMKNAEKILPSAIKYKEILSANKEVHMHILGVEEGSSIEGMLTRSDFLDFSQKELDRVFKPIEDVLIKAKTHNITIDDIQAIEFIGGGHRIPQIKDMISEVLPSSKVGTHMNGDEAIALGAGIIAANETGNAFPKKAIFLTGNGFNFDIKLVIENLDPEKGETSFRYCSSEDNSNSYSNSTLALASNCVRKIKKEVVMLKKRENFNVDRSVTFRHDSDFKVKCYEVYNDRSNLIVTYIIKGLTDKIISQIKQEEGFSGNLPKIKLNFSLDKFGMMTLRAELIYGVVTYLSMAKDPQTGKHKFTYTPQQQEKLEVSEVIDEISKINANKNYTKAEKEKFTKIVKNDLGKNKTETKIKALAPFIQHSFPLPLDKAQLLKSKTKLNQLDEKDELRSHNAEKRNLIEDLLYNKREWLGSTDAKKIGNQDELRTFAEELETIRKWYENEGKDAKSEKITEKINEINGKFKIFNDRIDILRKRETAIDYFYSEIASNIKEAKNLLTDKPWIEAYYNNEFTGMISEANEWLKEKIAQQENVKEYEEPVLTEKMIYTKLDSLRSEVKKMKRMPRPIVEEF